MRYMTRLQAQFSSLFVFSFHDVCIQFELPVNSWGRGREYLESLLSLFWSHVGQSSPTFMRNLFILLSPPQNSLTLIGLKYQHIHQSRYSASKTVSSYWITTSALQETFLLNQDM
jgi:hypothetical protein